MERLQQRLLLSLFVFGTFIVFVESQAPVRKGNICIDQKTCGACIAAGAECGWCSQEVNKVFDEKHKTQCDLYKNLIPNGCNQSNVVMPDHEAAYIKDIPPKNAEEGNDAVQLSPQEMSVKIRPNKPFEFTMKFRLAENYPVDLYYVMDLSNSMKDDKEKLAALGEDLGTLNLNQKLQPPNSILKIVATNSKSVEKSKTRQMSGITKNFRLGFGSFIDKNTMPYVSTVPANLREPCNGCVAPYGFKHQLNLTDDASQFVVSSSGLLYMGFHKNIGFVQRVKDSEISGNLDAPEGGFDAMMQAIVCKEIGWRPNSRKMLVYSSDQDFHIAGDGKLGGIVMPNDCACHLDKAGYYSESLNQDYPSISQISQKVNEENVNVIFAVTKYKLELYDKLSHFIEGSVTGELMEDSSNVVDLVKNNYDKISSTVELKAENAEGVYVKFMTKCSENDEFKDSAKCDNVNIGQSISYKVSIQITECPKNKEDWNRNIIISPVGLNDRLNINLQLICECECELPENEIIDSKMCSNSGTYECGTCTCNDGFYGKYCECDGSTVADKDYAAACKQTNTSKLCEGHGECMCGQCDCFPISPGDVTKKYSGTYCECDNYNCDYFDNMLCGGPTRGHCNCGECMCVPGYIGSACECLNSTKYCLAKNGKLCNGLGHCECGKCICNKDNKYMGPTCEDCPTCPGKCKANKACVQCTAFGTGEISKEDCEANCTQRNIAVIDHVEEKKDWRLCRARDESDKCYFYFMYELKNADNVKVQRTKECPKPVDILAIILGVIGGILIIGIMLLVLWKIIVTMYDKIEYAKFEKELAKAKWEVGENPLFQPATSTYENPMK